MFSRSGSANGTRIVWVMVSVPAMLVPTAQALTYSTQYEMDAAPSTLAGVLDANSADYNGDGVMSVGNAGSGATFSCGIMDYDDHDNTPAANIGYFLAGNDEVTSFTIDMRVRVISGVGGTLGHSLGFSGGPNSGPGASNNGRSRWLRLNTGSVQFIIGGSSEVSVDLNSHFVRLRVAYNSATNTYSLYNLDAGGAAVTSTEAGATGSLEIAAHGGYQTGSLSGGLTTDTHFQMDYFRVLLGTAVEDSTTVIQLLGTSSLPDADGDGIPDACDTCPHDPLNDADQDGICGDQDACPNSDLSANIVITGCDTGVPNKVLSGGCTMADEIAKATGSAKNHGSFVSAVAHLTNDWKKKGVISGADKGRIQSCAAKAHKP